MVTDWGVRRDDVKYYSGMPRRAVFILDPQSVVRWRWVRTAEEPLPDFDQVVAAAKAIAAASAPSPGPRGEPGAASTPPGPR